MKARPFALCLLLACLTACQPSTPPAETKSETAPSPKAAPPQPKAPVAELPPRDPAENVDREQRIPGDFKGNYVWAAATNLAWREMMDSILHGPAKFTGLSPKGKEIVRKLNASQMSKRDVDPRTYYIKSGFGQATVDEVNAALKQKFPKEIKENIVDAQLKSTHFLNFSMLMQNLEYSLAFKPGTVNFQGKMVEGFRTIDEVAEENVRILHYESDKRFLLILLTNKSNEQLFLAKGYPMQKPDAVLKEIDRYESVSSTRMVAQDTFAAPNLKMNYENRWPELLNHPFDLPKFKDHQIVSMKEKIDFEMNRFGIHVQAAMAFVAVDSGAGLAPKPKRLILDQPYWVILKRRDSPRPYFILGVRNTAMMTPVCKK